MAMPSSELKESLPESGVAAKLDWSASQIRQLKQELQPSNAFLVHMPVQKLLLLLQNSIALTERAMCIAV